MFSLSLPPSSTARCRRSSNSPRRGGRPPPSKTWLFFGCSLLILWAFPLLECLGEIFSCCRLIVLCLDPNDLYISGSIVSSLPIDGTFTFNCTPPDKQKSWVGSFAEGQLLFDHTIENFRVGVGKCYFLFWLRCSLGYLIAGYVLSSKTQHNMKKCTPNLAVQPSSSHTHELKTSKILMQNGLLLSISYAELH